jgi:Icc protein
LLIAHISDFHVFSDKPETALVRRDAERVARAVVEDLAAFRPALDAIAFTGDLTDGGSPRDYALLKDILSPLGMPILMVPGNHDKRGAFQEAFRDRLPLSSAGFLNYEIMLGGVRFLALDTLVEGRVDGALGSASLAFLEQRLGHVVPEPTFLLLHHPPFPSGILALDKATLVGGRGEVERVVRSYAGQLFILAGHIHRPFQTWWSGAFCSVAGSPAFQIALDLSQAPEEPGPCREPFAYFVYRVENGGVAIHTRYVSMDH